MFGCYNCDGWWGAEVSGLRVVLGSDLLNLSLMVSINNEVTWTIHKCKHFFEGER